MVRCKKWKGSVNIKRFILIASLFCVVTSDCMSPTSFWPFSWKRAIWNRALDFSSYYMERVKENNFVILALGIVGGLGAYAWWRYRQRSQKPSEPSSPKE